MNKDIKALLAIYTILILIGWNIALSKKVDKEFDEKIEAMSIAIQLDDLNEDYISMIEVMNSERDELENELKYIYDTQKLIKDLSRHSN